VPVGGGKATSLITGGLGESAPAGIAVDGANLYFANSGDGTINKVAAAGGTPTTLATGQGSPNAVAFDATYVYWTNASSGTVMRVAK
jgi:uncharacterized repeat protein (TIGR03803 family)